MKKIISATIVGIVVLGIGLAVILNKDNKEEKVKGELKKCGRLVHIYKMQNAGIRDFF